MATQEELELEDEDVLDFIQFKALSKLEPYKREYLEIQKNVDQISSSIAAKERDSEIYSNELNTIRDQVSYTRRNIDEISSSQEALNETMELMTNKRNHLMEKELSNRDEISIYEGYFDELKNSLSVGADWTTEQQEQKQLLDKERDFVMSKFENRMSQVTGIRGDTDRMYQLIQSLEEENAGLDGNIKTINTKISDYHKQARQLGVTREALDKKVFEVRANIMKAESDIAEKSLVQRSEDKSLEGLDVSLKESKDRMEVYLKQYDELLNLLQDLTGDLERQRTQNHKVEAEIEERNKFISERLLDVDFFTKESSKLMQLRDVALQKCAVVDEERCSFEAIRDNLNRQIAQIRDSEVLTVRRDIESQLKTISTRTQELEAVRKKQTGSERTSKVFQDLLQVNLNGKKNLGVEQKMLEEEVRLQKDQIRLILTEKERFEHEAEISNQQYYTSLEELKLQELQAQELQRKIQEDQGKLKYKQSLYEAVRSDRNLYSKQLIDSQEEINGLRRKFRSMNHHIDQLKDEISVKDHAIVKEHFLHHSVDKERELLRNELTKIRKQVQSSEGIIENQRVEIWKLNRIVEEADQERVRQRSELASVLAERNLLTNQVVKRNFELAQIYDRIKVQRSNLRIGERQYGRVVDNLAQLQRQLINLVQNQNDTIQGLAGIDGYKNKVIQLEKEIRTEQTKSRALLDELERPMNVHRWRVLESSDPKRFERITQIQELQRQLVSKADQVTQNDLLIQEKEKIYAELKNIISRQPGPEVEEQLLIYQQTLKDKVKQSAAMEEELIMYRQQINTFKEEIAVIDNKLVVVKKKWFKIKKSQDSTRS